MNSIGIRVQPSIGHYTIISHSDESVHISDINIIKVPADCHWPAKLKYIRRTLNDIIDEYSISEAGIRSTEAFSQNSNNERIVIEGIIQELFASSSVEKYFADRKSTRLNSSHANI